MEPHQVLEMSLGSNRGILLERMVTTSEMDRESSWRSKNMFPNVKIFEKGSSEPKFASSHFPSYTILFMLV